MVGCLFKNRLIGDNVTENNLHLECVRHVVYYIEEQRWSDPNCFLKRGMTREMMA